MKVTTNWKNKHEFESNQDANTIKLDGNKKNGFGPKALLLAGLAGCSGIDIVDILEKMRVEFSEFVIDTEAEQAVDHPKVFTKVMITYRIKTDLVNADKVAKAIALSLDKYCGVAAMLKKNSPVDYKLVIE
ncbi:MAG: OsmC family protein [Chitinophagaceae bacterium]|jgi:putative redox protein|nr:OsmC family protein [Chitinophagaceae bacterium]MBK7678756.1 OsmC family protein [Chitinophagaceae bacterium]MBK8299898.1 OsmC family protein [Chitinophagaceae bacterium]MBK9463950.1 OsmC family protein [Chitinophagaceae bacterium]MBK9939808.1 OsmC family protein [Chitinophagaceae bacterium]